MGIDFFSSADWLHRESNRGYGLLPIPQPRDDQISDLLRAWMTQDEATRKQSALQISDEQRLTLLTYSERMASRAVRERNNDLVVLGLVALGVDGWRADWRENVLITSLHFDAAQRIGANPAAAFETASSLLPEKSAQALRGFLRRSSRDQSLDAMGYVAGKDDDGFRYRRTW
jgi:hypothetical protein